MQRILTFAAIVLIASCAPQAANQTQVDGTTSVEPFKVGTFGIDGAQTVGVVLRDALIIDLAAANSALEADPAYEHIDAPASMIELIEHYEDGLKSRIYEIVNNVVGNDLLEANYVHGVEDVDILPPIMYPSKNMNAAVNFYCLLYTSDAADE